MKFTQVTRLAGMAALATGLALAQAGPGAGTNASPRHEGMKGQRFDRIAQKLGLTEDQKAQAKTIFETARNDAKQYAPQIKTAHEAFRTALQSGNDAELQKAADAQALLMAKVQVVRAKAMRDFEKLLTPEQLAKAKEMRGLMMGRFGARGGFGRFGG